MFREAPRRKAIEIASPPAMTLVAPLPVSSKSVVVESSLRSTAPSLLNPMVQQTPVVSRPIMVYNLPAGAQVTPSISSTTTSVSSVAGTIQPSPASTTILPIELQHKIVFVPPKPKEMKNKSVWCRPSNFNTNESTMSQSEQPTVRVTEPLDVPEPPKAVQCEIGTSTDEERYVCRSSFRRCSFNN